MIRINYVEACGAAHEVPATIGQTVMEVAIANNIPGIDADCGGQCACGTCHVYIEQPWSGSIPTARQDEIEMLNFVASSGPTSRLACQVKLSAGHDGIVIRLPNGQH